MRTRDTSPTLKVMPRDQETDVPRDTTVLITAPRPVDHLSAAGFSVRTADRKLEGTLDISSDGRILFWRPAGIMEAQARHHVVISGVRDQRGMPFDDLRITFVTGIFSYRDLPDLLE